MDTYFFSRKSAYKLALLFLCSLCLVIASNTAVAAIDLPLLQKRNPDFDWSGLHSGKVVWQALAESEIDDAELVSMVAVKLPTDINSVLAALQKDQPGVKNILLDSNSDASIRKGFNSFSVSREKNSNLEWFYSPEADGTFNVTREELEKLQKIALKTRDNQLAKEQALTAMDEVVRDLLARRVNEYRSGGMSAIRPYDIKGKQVHPGDYLAKSLSSLQLLQEEEDKFFQAFTNYPKIKNKDYEQQFFVTSETESGRPLISLKHWMIDSRDNFTLIAERKFYISHSLDAMHTLILLLHQDSHTYVFLVNQSFTQKVTGFGSFIAHKVGRSKVKQNILPLFEGLKKAFP
jgi:hypothetical protein